MKIFCLEQPSNAGCNMSFEMKCELITAIEENECLWNPYCEDYHKGNKRTEAWANIQRGLAVKGYQVHCKWQGEDRP